MNRMMVWNIIFWYIIWINPIRGSHNHYTDDVTKHKACYGTENGMATQSDRSKLINDMRQMYTNCTKVYGNLEIAGITLKDLEKVGLHSLDFFDNVEEVAGYVLIAYTMISKISFPKLRIIWGDKTFAPSSGTRGFENFSLLVISSNIQTLDMPSLRSVVEGRIGFSNTTGLCYLKRKSIDWDQILGLDYDKRRLVENIAANDTCFDDERTGKCSDECAYCWGPEDYQCQEIYRSGCAPQCTNGCFNFSNPMHCCSSQCAAGCYGHKNNECYGCKAMRDDNVCVEKCPSQELYNSKTMEYEHNPNGKYAWIRDCVKICPDHMVVYKEGCVARCPEGYYVESGDTICKQCEGPCPKTCVIEKPLSSMNIHEFVNCTVIDGRLEIRQDTMTGGTEFTGPGLSHFNKFRGLEPEELEVLSGIEQITHFLFVQSEDLTSLRFLRNLKQIDGRKRYQENYAMHITKGDNMRELGLRNLKRILNGDVYISENFDLCYVSTIPWNQIKSLHGRVELGKNRNKSICEREGRVCDELCDPNTGCWAHGSDMCFSCRYYKLDQTCVTTCSDYDNYYPNGKICEACHEECYGCKGAGPKNCISCEHVLLDNTCVDKCPPTHYHNITEGRCLECHANCAPNECTGPGNFVGDGGCKRCRLGVINDGKVTACLPDNSDVKECRAYPGLENYYWGLPPSNLWSFVDKACLKCDDECKTCVGAGRNDDPYTKCECKNERFFSNRLSLENWVCVTNCPMNSYSVQNDCYACHDQCDRCTGPEPTQCIKCRSYIDHIACDNCKTGVQVNCTDRCPSQRPYNSNGICSQTDPAKVLSDKHKRTQMIIGIVLAAVFLALIIVCTILFIWRRRVKAMKYLEPSDVIFEMHPDAKPNLAQLRLILETQLVKGQILGYGAFGTVLRGVWYPDEKKTKVLVAIKILHESNPSSQNEMLDEAGIMASMENEYVVQLIGVCVTQQLMLVTPLFPLGNLLDYLQNNKNRIGSLALLRWSTQIAKGMAYLEQRGLVHRDLAARNVLVQTPYHVRITDFGLAKMLEYGQEELRIYEGKMPIKWLALECIQHKRYTHKSDVWAYGVTIWELLTFGEKPYKDVPLQQIPMLLESGVRLPQPKICSIDIYLLLVKCWMVDANTRPSFSELAEEFSRMMKDPGRYLAIEGDALMRLPSYTSSDRRNMMEQLMDQDLLDERGSIRETEDLLNPSSPSTPISPFIPLLGESSVVDPSTLGPHLKHEITGRVQASNRHSSTSSHRYAADPIKKRLYSGACGKPAVAFEAVATDMDNYLVPDSQQRTSTSQTADPSVMPKYIPLLDDGAMDFYDYLKTATSEDTTNCGANHVKKKGLENLEYMMGNNNLPLIDQESSSISIDDSDRTLTTRTETETVL